MAASAKVMLMLITLLLLAVGPATAATSFPTLDRIASGVAGRNIEATCPTPDEWATHKFVRSTSGPINAFTWFSGDGRPLFMWLSPRACGMLVLLAVDPDDRHGSRLNGFGTRREQAAALLSLLHEAVHMSGVRDEGEAECRAVRAIAGAALELGVVRAYVLEALALSVHRLKPPAYQEVC